MEKREEILEKIAQAIFDKKGLNILALDIRNVSTLTDFLIIAEGNVDRHVAAIAKEVVSAFEETGESPLKVEGLDFGQWVVLDYGDIMVHLFLPSLREKYKLDKLWSKGKIIPLKIDV